MDELLQLIAGLVGDGFDEAARTKIRDAIAGVVETSSAGATDTARAEAKRFEAELKKAEQRATKAEEQLADAGSNADARVAELRTELDTAKAETTQLKADVEQRKLDTRLEKALIAAEVPEDRRAAALQLLDKAGIALDESVDTGLAGAAAAIESMKTTHAFLWEASAAPPGGGGPPAGGGGPNPKPPGPPGKPDLAKSATDAVYAAFKARRVQVRGMPADA